MRPFLSRPAQLLVLISVLTAPSVAQSDLIETVIPPPAWPDYFGLVVALDDETVAITALEDLGLPTLESIGRVSVISRADGSAIELTTSTPGDGFGLDLAVEGDFLAIASAERVDVFRRVPGGWDRVMDRPYPFVRSISLNGGRLAVGGYLAQGGSFVEVLRRTSSDGAQWESEAFLEGPLFFGNDVALWGDTLAVGRPDDFVGVYRRAEDAAGSSTWIEAAVLTGGVAASDRSFGSAVDLREDLLLVGAPYSKAGDITGRGAAFVYRRLEGEQGPWVLETVLKARPGSPIDGFGRTVAIGEDELYVGAYLDQVRAEQGAGSVTRYVRGGPGQPPWKTAERLFASDFHGLAAFGSSLATHGRELLVGAPGESFVSYASVYLYRPHRSAAPR